MKSKKQFTDTFYDWNTSHGKNLAQAYMIASRRPDLMKEFLDDLFSKKELEQCDARLYTAYLLALDTPYDFIRKMTGQSYTTIARISKKLRFKNGGYYSVLRELYPETMHHFDF